MTAGPPPVLVISSRVAYGAVGNAVIAPALETAGLAVVEVPTVVLSNHPGLGPPRGFEAAADDLSAILDRLVAAGWLDGCAGVLTGYFRTPGQVAASARAIACLRARAGRFSYLCDPVIGDDHGGLYVPHDVAEAIRDRLLPLADIATPNAFELAWLTGRPVAAPADAFAAAAGLGPRQVLVTSVPAGADRLADCLHQADRRQVHQTARRDGVPHGAGDLFAALFLAETLRRGDDRALARAHARLARVVAASAGRRTLDLSCLFAAD